VSRVGGSAQVKGLRKVSGRLRLDLAQYRELEAFAAFASDLDKASRAQLERGARLVELLKQPQYSPYSVTDETVSIWAGTTGQLDDVPVSDVRRFEQEFLEHLRRHRPELLTTITETNELSDDTVEALTKEITEFKQAFLAGDDSIRINEPPAKAMANGVERQEKVTRQVRPKPAQG
jgi:F-type H+-transporting ATPase subunit alpha